MSPADLRGWREARGLRQDDLATFLQVTKRTVRRWEVGDQPVPHAVAMLLGVMDVRGLTLDDAHHAALARYGALASNTA